MLLPGWWVSFFTLFSGALIGWAAGRPGLGAATGFGLGWFVIFTSRMSSRRILWKALQPLAETDLGLSRQFWDLFSESSGRLRLWVALDPAAQAYAGKFGGESWVVLTRGLLECLDDRELEAVLQSAKQSLSRSDSRARTWIASVRHSLLRAAPRAWTSLGLGDPSGLDPGVPSILGLLAFWPLIRLFEFPARACLPPPVYRDPFLGALRKVRSAPSGAETFLAFALKPISLFP